MEKDYNKLLKSGLLLGFHPELTGDWKTDRVKYEKIQLELSYKRGYDRCKEKLDGTLNKMKIKLNNELIKSKSDKNKINNYIDYLNTIKNELSKL